MKKIFIFFIIAAALVLIKSSPVEAADQIKTTEFFIASSESQFGSATSSAFTIYIGDNLSGVVNPVKSFYITATGLYTGGGSLQFMINSSATTSRVFTLPAVSEPTKFELLYKDSSSPSVVNPTSAGAYSYTLNTIPSGVVISDFGAKATLTHQFVPPVCADGVPANEKIKTTEHFIMSEIGQIASATSSEFTIYIGDNLAGVSNAVKSTYIAATGLYTGGGTLELMLNSDSNSSRIFTLPAVATPTKFELLYKDPSNPQKISPNSSGTYTYTLNVIPSGVTISAFGAKAIITHQYKPPSCAGGFPVSAELISATIDSTQITDGPAYNSILWKGQLGGPSQNQGKVRFQIAASDSSIGPWNASDFVGGNSCASSDWYDPGAPNTPIELKCFSALNNKRYFRYKVQICSNNCIGQGNFTPLVDDIVISLSP